MKNSHLVAPVFLAGDYHLPQMQSAPYVIVTNGADRFTLYSNFLPIDRCGEGDGAGDVEVVGESAAVYLFGQAVVARQLPVGSFFNIMSLLLILAMMG